MGKDGRHKRDRLDEQEIVRPQNPPSIRSGAASRSRANRNSGSNSVTAHRHHGAAWRIRRRRVDDRHDHQACAKQQAASARTPASSSVPPTLVMDASERRSPSAEVAVASTAPFRR